jgi:hypothetical protein
MVRRLVPLLLLALPAFPGELWVAVGPPELLKPLAPLVAHRRAQGLETALVEGQDLSARERFPRPPDYLLLVGDDTRATGAEPWRLAAPRLELYRWRAVQRERFASDAPWADDDGDGAADRPVGRIPARTPDEVAAAVRKILAFEQRAPGPDDLRFVAWAGASGYGAAFDQAQTALLLMTIRRFAPPWTTPWLMSADPSQPYCGWPPEQPDAFAREMRRGALFGAGLAHGNSQGFHSMEHGGESIWFGPKELARGFTGEAPAPPLVILSCNCGAFDGDAPSIAERALLQPGGPVAVIGATTESHPLPNYFTGVGLLKALAAGQPRRFGGFWLEAQRLGLAERDLLIEQTLKDVEGKLEAQIDIAKLKRDQLLLYAFLGDPALRVRVPVPLAATTEKVEGGWRFKAERPAGATRLVVGLLPAAPAVGAAPAGADEAALRRARLAAVNGAAEFAPLREMGEGPWEGVVDRPGRLRLVATGPDFVAACVLEMK